MFFRKGAWTVIGTDIVLQWMLNSGHTVTKARLSFSVKGLQFNNHTMQVTSIQITITRSCSVIKTSVRTFLMSLSIPALLLAVKGLQWMSVRLILNQPFELDSWGICIRRCGVRRMDWYCIRSLICLLIQHIVSLLMHH